MTEPQAMISTSAPPEEMAAIQTDESPQGNAPDIPDAIDILFQANES